MIGGIGKIGSGRGNDQNVLGDWSEIGSEMHRALEHEYPLFGRFETDMPDDSDPLGVYTLVVPIRPFQIMEPGRYIFSAKSQVTIWDPSILDSLRWQPPPCWCCNVWWSKFKDYENTRQAAARTKV